MAEAQSEKTPTLSEQYLLKGEEKPDVGTKSVEVKEVENPVNTASEEVVPDKAEGSPVAEESTEVTPVTTEDSSEVTPTATESTEADSAAVENSNEAAAEASSENSEEESAGDQEAAEEPEIKLETAPADFRFPTTNQTRHCFTRYIEYHRCIAAKGDDAPECDKFAKYYRALCPGEWVDRWNEQRENGAFPGPL
ncbi:cytochrome c oxidase subunit 6b-1 isoform X1 [Corylus avellana]|uniref:cytochrome c oxidase subunit 6b-1 isoform X1 n=1 Tax=Corylus avellana TaxID=13451 RepID=UPI00286B6A34|nr:cytochrome c oxidase subunit 6b-1 isoform X1 [Corylus avellana]